MAIGVVRSWHEEEGWGVLDSRETPGGCWFFYSDLWRSELPKLRPGESIRVGHRAAVVGETVSFDWERVEQDGYAFRATNVRPERPTPTWRPA